MTSKYSRTTALCLSLMLFVILVPVSVLGDEGMFFTDNLS